MLMKDTLAINLIIIYKKIFLPTSTLSPPPTQHTHILEHIDISLLQNISQMLDLSIVCNVYFFKQFAAQGHHGYRENYCDSR